MGAMARWLLKFRFERGNWGRVMRYLVGFLFVSMLFYYIPEREKSFTVKGSTEIVVVDMVSDGAPEWEVPDIEACIRTPAPPDETLAVQQCSTTLYKGVRSEEAVLRWSDGHRLTFRILGKDQIEIFVERSPEATPVLLDQEEITNGSFLYIPFQNDGERVLLPVRGYVTIGDVPNASDSFLLIDGRYEIRQELELWKKPYVVEDGTLFPGDRISFARNSAPIWFRWSDDRPANEPGYSNSIARLFITDLDPKSAAFDLVATTEPAYSDLLLTRVGGQPTRIPVSWTQRLLRDALPAAIATLLGLLATSIALSNAYFASSDPNAQKAGEKSKK